MKMNRTYKIETGNWKKDFEGRDMISAAVAAFKRFPPKHPSILTRMSLKYPQIGETNKKIARWHYIDTTVLLKKVGYRVEISPRRKSHKRSQNERHRKYKIFTSPEKDD